MSRLTQRGQGAPIEIFNTVTVTDPSLGTLTGAKFDAADGREFVLVQNGGSAITAGLLVQGPAEVANHKNLVTSTAAIGATQVTVTLGATSAYINMYQGGYVVFNAGTGIGQTLKISSHPGAASSATLVLTLEDPIQVATLASDTKSTLILPPYGSSNGGTYVSSASNTPNVSTSGVVVCPVTLTGPVIGVTVDAIPASTSAIPSYGLIQTKGIVSCLNDATTAIGLDLMPSANTAGAVQTYVVATKTRVGTSTVAGVTTESRPITIQL